MRIYRGWYIVAASMLVFAIVVGASMQAFGLFVVPVSEAYGLSRAEMNTAAIALNIGMALAAPLIGRLLDRRSARQVMFASAVLFGGSLAALGLISSIWVSTIIIFVPLALSAVGAGTLTSPALLARWFVVHRGRAMAIATAGISLGPIAVVPLIGIAIEQLGWRDSLVVTGVAAGTILMSLCLVVRDAPGANDVEPGIGAAQEAGAGGTTSEEAPIAVGDLVRLPAFWTIALGSSLAFGILAADLVTIVPLAQSGGLSIAESAALMSTFGIASIAGTAGFGWLGDRLNRIAVFAAACLLLGSANAAFLFAGGRLEMHAVVAAIGFASGINTPAFLALIAETFGARSFGIATGCASLVSTLICAAVIRFGGEVFDRTGSYRLMLLAFLAFGIVAAALVVASGMLSRYRGVLAR